MKLKHIIIDWHNATYKVEDDVCNVFLLPMTSDVLWQTRWRRPKWATTLCRQVRYLNVIMGALASQITSFTIVYLSVYSGADQRKHQSSASLAFVWGIHRWPVNSPHKWSVTRKMFPFDDVIMDNANHYAWQIVVRFIFHRIQQWYKTRKHHYSHDIETLLHSRLGVIREAMRLIKLTIKTCNKLKGECENIWRANNWKGHIHKSIYQNNAFKIHFQNPWCWNVFNMSSGVAWNVLNCVHLITITVLAHQLNQLRKPIGSEIKWAECPLIMRTGCWVQVLLDPR